jgi:hypothetical protein
VSTPASRTVASTLSSCRHTIVSPPLGELHSAPLSAPSGRRLTSPVLSSNCRTCQCPPWPLELHHRLGTPLCRAVFSTAPPPAISGENPATPPCSAQPPSVPHGVRTLRTTPRPLVKPRQPHHHASTMAGSVYLQSPRFLLGVGACFVLEGTSKRLPTWTMGDVWSRTIRESSVESVWHVDRVCPYMVYIDSNCHDSRI